MNILVIPTTDWTRHPVPNRLNFIFENLSKNHNVYVLHFPLGKFKDNPPRDTQCTLIDSGIPSIDDPSLFYLLSSLFHLRDIRKITKEMKIDVILSANILPSFFANFSGIPVVFDYLDHLEESASVYYPNSFLGRIVKRGVKYITRYNLRHSRAIITVTDELKGYLKAIGITHVTVIPNGVDTEVISPLPKEESKKSLGLQGKNVIGYVGSLEYWVDLETVICALPFLNVVLLVIGPELFTDYGAYIKKMIEKLGVADRVIFTGAIDYAEINLYISAMDIGLNPLKMMKKNEYAAGGKVFNYLACGRPVLSSRMVSLERLLGDILYYYNDVASFIASVNSIMESTTDEHNYREISREFDWKILAKKYETVLIGAK